jgi:ParB family transcriptional regulator, chromosome partitioning protein
MTDHTERAGRARRRFTVDALFSDTRPQAVGVSDLADAKEIQLSRIEPDPQQPRRTFDEERLEELSDSIRSEGVLQPIVVRYDQGRDIYVLVHGERRWRASQQAGLQVIPALVRDVPPERRLLQQLMENVVRDDLNAVDRAAALRALRDQLGGVPWEQVAETVGIKRSRLFQLLGTEKLAPKAQEDIQSGRLSEKQSRALQGLSVVRQEALRELIVEEKLTAAAASRLAKAFRNHRVEPEDDPAAAREGLHDLYALVASDDPEHVRTQTHVLLAAVRDAQASELAHLLAAPRFDSQRVVREVSALARSLARVDRDRLAAAPDAADTLRALRDALDTLIGDGQ